MEWSSLVFFAEEDSRFESGLLFLAVLMLMDSLISQLTYWMAY